jgi:hypothetical protein
VSPPQRDNRFLALRAAGLDATDDQFPDSAVERFLELRDAGAQADAIGRELELEPQVVEELVAADESYAVAHRIATGQEQMYPPPGPDDRVLDTRAGSSVVPVVILIGALVLVIAYAILR